VHATGVHRFIANQDLRLTDCQYRRNRRIVQRCIGIHQHDAAWMLGLRRAHQSPHRGTGQVGDVFPRQSERTAR
jgi:hypothetical protein